MRWSLVLSAFIAVQSALSFVCVALPVPPLSDGLERRSPKESRELKLASKRYRQHAMMHSDAYHVDSDKATVTKKELKEADRLAYGKKMIKTPNMQADHVFEVQMLKDHLKNHNIHLEDMDPGLRHEIKGILNGPKNMAFIPASINQSKGQLIKHGMAGNKIQPQKVRNDYALQSYSTAHHTAVRLDEALQKHPGYKGKEDALQKKLHSTFLNAGLHPVVPISPASSSHSSPSPGSSSGHQGHSNPRQSTPPPPSPNQHPAGKRPLDASPGKSPARNKPKTENKPKTRTGSRKAGRKK